MYEKVSDGQSDSCLSADTCRTCYRLSNGSAGGTRGRPASRGKVWMTCQTVKLSSCKAHESESLTHMIISLAILSHPINHRRLVCYLFFTCIYKDVWFPIKRRLCSYLLTMYLSKGIKMRCNLMGSNWWQTHLVPCQPTVHTTLMPYVLSIVHYSLKMHSTTAYISDSRFSFSRFPCSSSNCIQSMFRIQLGTWSVLLLLECYCSICSSADITLCSSFFFHLTPCFCSVFYNFNMSPCPAFMS